MPGSEPPTPALRDVPLTLERVFPQREWRAGEATAWMSERNLLLKLADVFEAQGRVPSDRELDAWLTTPCITCRVRASGGFYIKPVAPIDLAVLGHDEVVVTAFSESLRLSAAYREDHLDRRRQVFQNLIVLVVDGLVRSPAPPALATFVEHCRPNCMWPSTLGRSFSISAIGTCRSSARHSLRQARSPSTTPVTRTSGGDAHLLALRGNVQRKANWRLPHSDAAIDSLISSVRSLTDG